MITKQEDVLGYPDGGQSHHKGPQRPSQRENDRKRGYMGLLRLLKMKKSLRPGKETRDHNPAKQLGLACWPSDVPQASYMNKCVG